MCSVDWGLVVSALAAAGSVSAAVIALAIATRDRRDRQAERLAAAEAEAKLVLTSMTMTDPDSASWLDHPEYHMVADNNGHRPILDVTVLACSMRSDPTAAAKLPDSAVPIVKAHSHSQTSGVQFVAADGTPLPHEKQPNPRFGSSWPSPNELDIVGWLGFSDVHGNQWARSSKGELRRITKPSDIKRLTS